MPKSIPPHLQKPTLTFHEGRKVVTNMSSEFPVRDNVPEAAPSAPQPPRQPKAPFVPQRRIVGQRTALYGQNRATNRNPVAKAEGNWRGAQDTD